MYINIDVCIDSCACLSVGLSVSVCVRVCVFLLLCGHFVKLSKNH